MVNSLHVRLSCQRWINRLLQLLHISSTSWMDMSLPRYALSCTACLSFIDPACCKFFARSEAIETEKTKISTIMTRNSFTILLQKYWRRTESWCGWSYPSSSSIGQRIRFNSVTNAFQICANLAIIYYVYVEINGTKNCSVVGNLSDEYMRVFNTKSAYSTSL